MKTFLQLFLGAILIGTVAMFIMYETRAKKFLELGEIAEAKGGFHSASVIYSSVLNTYFFSFSTLEAKERLQWLEENGYGEFVVGGIFKRIFGDFINPLEVDVLPLFGSVACTALLFLVFILRWVFRRANGRLFFLLTISVVFFGFQLIHCRIICISGGFLESVKEFEIYPQVLFLAAYVLMILTFVAVVSWPKRDKGKLVVEDSLRD